MQVGANLVIAAPHDRAHLQRWLEPSVSEELADRTCTAALLVARSAGSVLLTRPPRPAEETPAAEQPERGRPQQKALRPAAFAPSAYRGVAWFVA